MPRAHRHFVPGHIWHITHRCHRKQFLLKAAADRRRWLRWLFEARQRFNLCVLDYVVTSNHIHLLVRDRGRGEISSSLQLVAGRTGQEYNQRRNRRGAFWEDRYHATAVETDEYLARCLVYIDLNMVRAGVVTHPMQWDASGYRDIQEPRKRYRIVDLPALVEALGMSNIGELQRTHAEWVAEALRANRRLREEMWSESLAVGSRKFIEDVKQQMGSAAAYRTIESGDASHQLREPRRLRWQKRGSKTHPKPEKRAYFSEKAHGII